MIKNDENEFEHAAIFGMIFSISTCIFFLGCTLVITAITQSSPSGTLTVGTLTALVGGTVNFIAIHAYLRVLIERISLVQKD